MASHGNKRLRDQMALTAKHLRRPSNMLLKDYLRDDLSSSSSSGFKSFPRRQCCSTVRFGLLEKDLQAKRNRLLRLTSSISHRSSCSSKVASSTISAIHKASRAVINAVKLLPFPSISPTPSSSYRKNNNSMKRLLSKSLSRKMLSRSFWRKAIEEEEEDESKHPRWKSFREFLEEKDKPLDQQTQSSSIISVTLGSSCASGSSGRSNGNSWGSSSEFTWEILRSMTTSYNNSDVGFVSSSENSSLQKNTATKTTSEDSTDGCTLEKLMDWSREVKEQLSPVSVLNGPFGDDEEINSPMDSTSYCGLECDETICGSKNKQTQKIRHFDHKASSLKPIDLEKRMTEFSEAKENIKGSEEEMWMLINELESSRFNSAENKLLFDLFSGSTENEDIVTKMAKEWTSGESKGVSYMGWQVCAREMVKCERWTNISNEQVGIQLEFEVLTSLMNELVLELITSPR
ncbi:hypothetical protein QN277_028240 [Acacia crassicarpa]|uniref:DUF4378 domain-containing protein n=1 Tax=Acacia crassicarpa TaxID=499986 RepID=A0AAE1J4D5_9FABA|nr:hypothetical protein QN277_028240 [Acacia crassicarpa]